MVTAIEPIPAKKSMPKLSLSHEELELLIKLLKDNEQEELAKKYIADLEAIGYSEPIKPLFMAFRDFKKIKQVTKTFGLKLNQFVLFPEIEEVEPSEWLKHSLDVAIEYSPVSEKERSEWLVQPILDNFRLMSDKDFHLYSGRHLNVDKEKGLRGECDFLYAFSSVRVAVEAPIFAAIESKAETVQQGLAQCAAQMIGIKLYNEQEDSPLSAIYGCVTTGYYWQFMKLKNDELSIDTQIYNAKSEINSILGIWKMIVEDCQSHYIFP